MNDYNFSTLNDKEFENLTIDLISRDRGKRFERFKAGRDGGIDGRYYGEDGRQEIIQCKQSSKDYTKLISSLKSTSNGKKSEIDKVRLLNPEKYIFVTSVTLSALNKTKIKKIFDPYIKNDSDIYGQEDLNDLLKANPDIEENHYKLWISSTTVLQRIFNNAIKGRSEFLLEEIQDKIKYYVVTENHNRAIEKLESSHTIIIAGEPGIGKTTLAEQIVLNYIEKGFEFCVIVKDISEADNIFEKDKKQIFYFDDFLGANYRNVLEAHFDSHIMQFITRIKRDKTKRFILTSRTNIFNQGLLLSDKFRTKKLDSDEFIITVDELREIDKAKILYNHIWHSNLSEEYIDELYKEKRYKKIINHKNFNPRLIEFITDIERINSNSANSYWVDIQRSLNNPSEIWKHSFNEGSDEYIRNIVSLVVFNGNSIEENELKKSYNRLNGLMNLQNTSHSPKDFNIIIKKTVRFFLKRILSETRVDYSLFNPSIADFIINRNQKDKEKLKLYLISLRTTSSLKTLKNLIVDSNEYSEILLSVMEEEKKCFSNQNYFFNLSYLLYKEKLLENNNELLMKIFNDFLDKNTLPKLSVDNFYKFIEILIFYILEESINIFDVPFLIKIINANNTSDINLLSSFIKLLDLFPEEEDFKNKLIEELEDYLKDYLSQESYNIDFSIVDYSVEEYDEKFNIIYDEDEILSQLRIILDDIINDEFDINVTRLLNKDSIIEYMDIDDIINSYEIREAKSYTYNKNYQDYEEKFSDIDDLFERS